MAVFLVPGEGKNIPALNPVVTACCRYRYLALQIEPGERIYFYDLDQVEIELVSYRA